MTAAERIDAALSVALETVIACEAAAEITLHDAERVIDIVGAALRVVRSWSPEWETSGAEL